MTIYTPNPEELGRKRFPDNKSFRKNLRDLSINYLNQLQDLLPSNYPKDPSTNLAKFYKVIARETARLKLSNDSISNDKDYTETRPEYLHQILGERLFLGNRIAPSGYNDETYKNYLLAIKSAYLKGSKKSNIESIASQFTGQRININELYLKARENNSSLDVTDTHRMVVDVFIDDLLTTDINTLKDNLDFFINLTQPAHVLYDTRLIWTEFLNINKVSELFGDLGGGCIPSYDFDYFQEPTVLALQIFILPNSSGATGLIDSIHNDQLIFYFNNSTRVITEPGINGTHIFDVNGRRVAFDALRIGQFVRLSYVIIPGEFKFWWHPSDLIHHWEEQFYKDIYRRPVFQEFVKKLMDSKGRFPLQVKSTNSTICDRWVQDALQPMYEDLRSACSEGPNYKTYDSTLSINMGFPKLSLPYYNIIDTEVNGSNFIYYMNNYPLTDGTSQPATVNDVEVILNGSLLTQPIYSIDSSTGRVNLKDTSSYWGHNLPVPGDTLLFNYRYLNDNTNYDGTSLKIYGISSWQMPNVPIVDSSGNLSNNITVIINDTTISNSIVETKPLLGHVILNDSYDFWVSSELGRLPTIGDTFTFKYYYGQKYQYSMIFDELGYSFDTVSGYESVYNILFDGVDSTSPIFHNDPIEIGYRYRGHLLHHSSVLNSPNTLNLNEFQKPANRASIANKESVLNHFNTFFSPEFLYDRSSNIILDDQYLINGLDPILKLKEGTPPFQKTFSYHPGLVYQQKLQDIRTNHKLLMYSDLLLKETQTGDKDTHISPICDSDKLSFKIRIGENINKLEECDPWELFDTVKVNNVTITIPGNYESVPNLRIAGKNLRQNFILRGLELTGTSEWEYSFYTESNSLPLTEFYLPHSFKYNYNGEYIDFPALPMTDSSGGTATIDDITVTVDGTAWNIVDFNSITGWVKIDEYPLLTVMNEEYIITAQDIIANRITLPGYIVNPSNTVFSVIHGTSQYYDRDFYIDGKHIGWLGRPLQGLFEVGDKIKLSYIANTFINKSIVVTYNINSSANIDIIDLDWSRIFDYIYVFPGLCSDGYGIELGCKFDEFYSSLDDYSEGIKAVFFNKDTKTIEEHVFSGPVFEYYDVSKDEIAAPDNFPNALIRIKTPMVSNNPLNYIADYGFLNDKVVRFRKKTFKELLPTRLFRTLELIEMLPI